MNKLHNLAVLTDIVFYKGEFAEVVNLCHRCDGEPMLQLVSINDPWKTCMALEADCITRDNWFKRNTISKSGIVY